MKQSYTPSESAFIGRCRRMLLFVTLMLCCIALPAAAKQRSEVAGTVRDEAGAPLPGVAVTVSGTSRGTTTDGEGRFSIRADAADKLNFSFLGYKPYVTQVGTKTALDVQLTVDNTNLDEVVVIGYGVQRRRDIVGAVETIKGDLIAGRKTANVSRALQGQVPGLTLTFSDGKPSRNATIRIRGVENSIGAGGSALTLVDGMETDMNTVNPSDIESITVLKDASSTAVYGAKGTFGVILITTKKPDSGHVSVTYDGSYSIFTRTVEPRTVNNGLAWTDAFLESYKGRYNANPSSINNAMNPFTSSWYNELVKRNSDKSYEKWDVNAQGRYEYFGNYDWHDIVYKDWTSGQQHNVSVSGGGKVAKFLVSGRYFQQDGIYNYGKEDYKQYNIRGKVNIQVTPWLTLDNSLDFMKRKIYQPRVAEGNQLIQRQMEIVGAPMIGARNADGTWTHAATYIGIAGFEEGTSWEKYGKNDVHETATLTASLIKDVLVAKADFAYFYSHTDRSRARNLSTYYEGPELSSTQPATSQYRDYDYDTDRWTASATLTYTPKLGDAHSLSVMGGFNAEEETVMRTYLYREGIIIPDKVNPSLIDGDQIIWQDNGSYSASLAGFFYRLHYAYKGKYLVEASGRYDGNSKFPTSQRWGFFPSASVGWRISEEGFLAASRSWLDNLKVRFSAGTAGNGLISDAYAYLPLMELNTSNVVSGGSTFRYTRAPAPVPRSLTWEKATTYNLGLDFEALNGRLSFVADIYRRNTSDMYVVGAELPAVYGNQAPKGNYADMRTDGWEASVSWRDNFRLAGKDFHYSIRAAVWDSTSKITKYTSKTGTLPTIYKTNYYEGMTLGEIWGYKVLGLFESDEEAAGWADQSKFQYFVGGWKKGDLKLADLDDSNAVDNGSNTIGDHGDLVKIGNTSPRYCYSITTSFNWNGIGLSMMWQGVGKRDWYPAKDSGYFWGKYGRAYGFYLPWQDQDNRYTDDNGNTSAYWPRLRGYQAEHSNGIMSNANDRYLQDASYIRLKNLTLDYTFPKRIARKLHMQSLRIYFVGENLWTYSPLQKYAKNFDPEGISAGDADFGSVAGTNGDGYGYPVMRTFTFGVNVTF